MAEKRATPKPNTDTVEKPFIRVKDKLTGHQYDIHRQAFNDTRHEVVARYPDSWKPRPPKPNALPRTPQTPATEAGTGDRPTGD